MPDAPEPHPDPTNLTQPAAVFRSVPHASESFGNVPKAAEAFRTVPNASESFRNVPQTAVRRENCTLTVREVTRMFEAASVARSERSITNWCQPNRQGIARLEAYFDPNERRYFITPQSVEAVIAEEKAKASKAKAEPLPHVAEESRTGEHDSAPFRSAPNASAVSRKHSDSLDEELDELRMENRDLQITNRSKDLYIERMERERDSVMDKLVSASRQIGQLETKVLQLAQPSEIADTGEVNLAAGS